MQRTSLQYISVVIGFLACLLTVAYSQTGQDIDTGTTGCPTGLVCLTTYQSGVSRRGQNNSESVLTYTSLTSTTSPKFHHFVL
jgi:hypothetical protein